MPAGCALGTIQEKEGNTPTSALPAEEAEWWCRARPGKGRVDGGRWPSPGPGGASLWKRDLKEGLNL